MSGIRGRVQALLQNKVGEAIPYIHCYSHQLHLAVVHAMQADPCAKTFFDLSGSLHSFFHRHYVSQQYDVPSLKHLLEIRWTSHNDVTKCLMENQDGIISILSEVSEDSAAAVDICTEASGLLMILRKHHFFEVGGFLLKVLVALRPANAILQAHSVDLYCAGEVVIASLQDLRGMRDDESLTNFDIDDHAPAPAVKRKRTMCSQLTGSVVLSTVDHTENSMTPSKSLKRALLNILERAIIEMETRFSRGNLDLMKAVSCLLPQSPSFLDVGMLSPLQKLTGSTDSDRHCN